MGVQYTKEQQRVIDVRDRNLLVSAAAGSGKTAVLVERLINRIMDQENPVNIDQMLVMTFTEAAASEMKERISKAIEQELLKTPDSSHLQKQALLVHSAPISTIHRFCLNVIRNHFHEIDLDPGFRVADEGECRLLKAEIMQQVLEEAYQDGDDDFLHMTESYSSKKTDVIIEDLVGKLYQYAMSYPMPKEWLRLCEKAYDVTDKETLGDFLWMDTIMNDVRQILQDIRAQIKKAEAACCAGDGPSGYLEAVKADRVLVDAILESKDFSMFERGFACMSFERLGRNSSKASIDPYKLSLVKTIRDNYKKQLTQLKEQYFFDTDLNLFEGMKESARAVRALVTLTEHYIDRYGEAKRAKNIIDFNDMEHMALDILLEQGEEGLVPSKTAKEYQEYYEEVLLDEYQDSNLVQEYLVKSISKQEKQNVFMVGDVKQSIYRFRLARPELFMEKYHSYQVANEDHETNEPATPMLSGERIDLHKNFRSRKNVLATVNDIFCRIMRKEVGGIDYDEAAALNYGLDYPEIEGNLSDQTEYLILKRDSKSENKVELEAKMVADRIKKLVTQTTWNQKEQCSQTIMFRDIVILLRATGGNDEVFRKVLEEAGIPVHIASKTGYFETVEVETVLSYLQILDNPLQDIPLTATLKSVFGKFTDEELARIRCTDRKRTMYHALISYEEDDQLKKKIDQFLALFYSFRERIPYTSVYYLIEQLLRETGYLYYVRALPNGEKRYANVRMLLEKAESYGKTSYKGLFHFIRYIGYLRKYDVDYGEANTISENDNAVRIMSIHKSKGLEFPICFLSMTGKSFNFMDSRQSIGYDMEYGIGVDYVDWKRRTKTPTILKKLIQKKEKTETIAEELRVLYVALTRAKEKLIITGVIDEIEQKLQSYVAFAGDLAPNATRDGMSDFTDETVANRLPVSVISSFTSYADMILSALIGNSNIRREMIARELTPSEDVIANQSNIELQILEIPDLIETEMQESISNEARYQHFMWLAEHQTDTSKIDQLFSYVYPFERTAHIKMKVSVSELKEAHMNDEIEEEAQMLFAPEENVPYIPHFISLKEDVSAVQRGTVYHKLMEIMDYQLSVEEMMQIPEYKELLKVVRVNDLRKFKDTKLAARMRQADGENRLYREQPFVLGVPANTVYPEASELETVLVQGIIDAYFVENEKVVVVDYKTDRVANGSELISRYQTQLDHYANALEQLTGLEVSEKIIYSFALHEEIVLL